MFFDDFDQKAVLFLRGEFTFEDVDAFRKAILQRIEQMQVADFILECSELEFIDSQGLESLLWLEQVCAERLGQVRLVSPHENIKTILRMTRLASRLETHEGIQTALSSLQ